MVSFRTASNVRKATYFFFFLSRCIWTIANAPRNIVKLLKLDISGCKIMQLVMVVCFELIEALNYCA